MPAKCPNPLDIHSALWYSSTHIEGVVSTEVRQINMHGRNAVWFG